MDDISSSFFIYIYFFLHMKFNPVTWNPPNLTESNSDVEHPWSNADGRVDAVIMKCSETHKMESSPDHTLIRFAWWKHTFSMWSSLAGLQNVFTRLCLVRVSKTERLEKWMLELCRYFSIWPLNPCLHSLVGSNGTMSTRASCQNIHAARQWGRLVAL